jgi:L-alanine-DL-glutamate epimerase-like enolase superfamily enzyme
MRENHCRTLIADGEPEESRHLMRWVKDGIIDVLQYDIISPGFTRWLELADEINPLNLRAAPHHFGAIYGNYATCHVAPALRRFEMVEWDEATIDALDASGYRISDGKVSVPDRPGFGLELDGRFFAERVKDGGWVVGP